MFVKDALHHSRRCTPHYGWRWRLFSTLEINDEQESVVGITWSFHSRKKCYRVTAPRANSGFYTNMSSPICLDHRNRIVRRVSRYSTPSPSVAYLRIDSTQIFDEHSTWYHARTVEVRPYSLFLIIPYSLFPFHKTTINSYQLKEQPSPHTSDEQFFHPGQ